MRMFKKAEPFMDVKAEHHPAAFSSPPASNPLVFSEEFLYPSVGTGDARFILGVAEEYSRVIEVLGTKLVKEILEGKFSASGMESIREVLSAAVANEKAS